MAEKRGQGSCSSSLGTVELAATQREEEKGSFVANLAPPPLFFFSSSHQGKRCLQPRKPELMIARPLLGAECAAVAVVLLTPPPPRGVFPALVLTNLPRDSSGPPQDGRKKTSGGAYLVTAMKATNCGHTRPPPPGPNSHDEEILEDVYGLPLTSNTFYIQNPRCLCANATENSD